MFIFQLLASNGDMTPIQIEQALRKDRASVSYDTVKGTVSGIPFTDLTPLSKQFFAALHTKHQAGNIMKEKDATIADLTIKLKEAIDLIQQLQKKLNENKKDLDDLKIRLESSTADKVRANEDLVKKTAEQERLQREMNDAQRKSKVLQADVDRLEERARASDTARVELEERVQAIPNLTARHDALAAENEKSRARAQSLEEELAQRTAQVAAHRDEVEQLTAKHRVATATAVDHKKDLDQSREAHRALTAEHDQAKKTIAEKTRIEEANAKIISDLREQLAQARSEAEFWKEIFEGATASGTSEFNHDASAAKEAMLDFDRIIQSMSAAEDAIAESKAISAVFTFDPVEKPKRAVGQTDAASKGRDDEGRSTPAQNKTVALPDPQTVARAQEAS